VGNGDEEPAAADTTASETPSAEATEAPEQTEDAPSAAAAGAARPHGFLVLSTLTSVLQEAKTLVDTTVESSRKVRPWLVVFIVSSQDSPSLIYSFGTLRRVQLVTELAEELDAAVVMDQGRHLGERVVTSSLGALETVGRTALDVVGEDVRIGRHVLVPQSRPLT